MENATAQTKLVDLASMALISALGSNDCVRQYQIKEGDVIRIDPIDDPKDPVKSEITNNAIPQAIDYLQVMPDSVYAVLAMLAHPTIAEIALDKLKGCEEGIIPQNFRLGAEYQVVGIDAGEPKDMFVRDETGHTFSLFSGLLALKTATINGKHHEEIMADLSPAA